MGLEIETDEALCIGSENCTGYAPRTFATNDDGVVTLLPAPHDDEPAVRLAVSACPVGALSVKS